MQEKKIPPEMLQNLQIKTSENGTSIVIPYFDENKKFVRNRVRNSPKNPVRFYWDVGESTCLYGANILEKFSDDYIILVEGETDAITLWFHDIPGIGVPGAKTFRKEYAPMFDRFKKIYIHNEEDSGATEFINKMASILPGEKLYTISSRQVDETCKDISDLHVKGVFDFDKLIATATPLVNEEIFLKPVGNKPHVEIGLKLIEQLDLKYRNSFLYYYIPFDIRNQELIEMFIWIIRKKEKMRNWKSRFLNMLTCACLCCFRFIFSVVQVSKKGKALYNVTDFSEVLLY